MYYENQQQPPVAQVKAKKKHGCLITLLVMVCIAGAVAVSAYFLLPGMLRPNDLGVKSSIKAYESTVKKLMLSKDKAPDTGTAEDYKVIYGNPQEVVISLDSEEITSFINENRPDYYALKNVQVRINPDNTVEAAATLDTSYVFDDILAGKYGREDAEKELPMLGLLPDKVNLYCKLSGSIKDNKTQGLSLQKVSVMGIPIPESLAGSAAAKEFISDTLDEYLARTATKSGASYDLLQVDNGKLELKGKIPASISRIPVK